MIDKIYTDTTIGWDEQEIIGNHGKHTVFVFFVLYFWPFSVICLYDDQTRPELSLGITSGSSPGSNSSREQTSLQLKCC